MFGPSASKSILRVFDRIFDSVKMVINDDRVYYAMSPSKHCCNVACVSLFFLYYKGFLKSKKRGPVLEWYILESFSPSTFVFVRLASGLHTALQ